MNMFKKNGGFTLVELVVVIAILAILAGVAVPAYSGYIARANDAAVLSELAAIHTAAQSACALNGESVNEIEVTASGVTINPSSSDISEDFADFYTASANWAEVMSKHSSGQTTFTWSNGEWDILASNSGAGGN